MPAVLGILVITVARVVLLGLNQTDLHAVEAQAWLCAQSPAAAPSPLTAWLIAAFTAFSDSPFWVRLPAPLLHAATALILGGIADRLFGARMALATALAYGTLPVVALGSLILTPETVAAPFLAGAFALYLRLLDSQTRTGALAVGAALGAAVLGHPAAGLGAVCACTAGILFGDARPRAFNALLLAIAFLLTLAPVLALRIWSGQGLPSPNVSFAPDPWGWGRFGLALMMAAGPVFVIAVLGAAITWPRQSPIAKFLLIFVMPFLGLAALTALLGLGSWVWGAAACLFGLPVALAVLSRRYRKWRMGALAFNAAIALALPLATLAPDLAVPGGAPILSPLIGRTELGQTILDIGADLQVRAIVVGDPEMLADIAYAGREGGIGVFAPPGAAAPNLYQPGPEDVLLILPEGETPPCPVEVMDLAEMTPDSGAYRNRPQRLYLIPGACLAP